MTRDIVMTMFGFIFGWAVTRLAGPRTCQVCADRGTVHVPEDGR